jgi:hypothetical protein
MEEELKLLIPNDLNIEVMVVDCAKPLSPSDSSLNRKGM